MRVTVRGLHRDCGETEIMNVALEPETRDSYYLSGRGYWRIENNEHRPKRTKAYLIASTEPLRLGGRYFHTVELSRGEIAKLFFATLKSSFRFHHDNRARHISRRKKAGSQSLVTASLPVTRPRASRISSSIW